MKSTDLINLLRQRYADSRRYLFLEEVPSCTGAIRNRRGLELLDGLYEKNGEENPAKRNNVLHKIDALVLPLYPSDGLGMYGFEIKVSRSDFLSEIRDTGKNSFWRDVCRQFWYVTAQGIVEISDIPDDRGCGWLEATEHGLMVRQRPSDRQLKSEKLGWSDNAPVSASLLAAIARAAKKEGERS